MPPYSRLKLVSGVRLPLDVRRRLLLAGPAATHYLLRVIEHDAGFRGQCRATSHQWHETRYRAKHTLICYVQER